MSEKYYECMFILDANAYARDPGGAAQSVQKMIESSGGTLLASRLWNEQKMAYPIKGRHKGAYWLTYFKSTGEMLGKFNRACQLNDLVLRHLPIKIDPRLIETLVAAASGEAQETPAETPAEGEKAEEVKVTSEQPEGEKAVVDG